MIVGCLLILLIFVAGGAILLLSEKDFSLKDTINTWLSDEETNHTNDNQDIATDDETEQSADSTTDNSNTSDSTVNMTDLWSDYYNSSYYAGFKYPQELTYDENSSNPEETVVTFKGGDDTTVFTVWFKSMGDLESSLTNMLANQCTNDTTFTDVMYGTLNFRKAVDVPLESCLAALGVTRDEELAAYGALLPGEVILSIRNDGLNQEQLEALLSTVYAE